MELNEDPGPIDNYVLYDQENHVSSAVWDGQVGGFSYLLEDMRISYNILILCYSILYSHRISFLP